MIINFLITCILLDVARELFFKLASRSYASNNLSFPMGIIRSFPSKLNQHGWVIGGFVVWGAELLVWAKVLTQLPLNIAFPIMSLTYSATPIAAKVFLGEQINLRRWSGIVLITAGAMIVGAMGVDI